MHSAHYAVSYRASFKPELPAFFIQKFLKESSGLVLDPFGGRGTTAFQANLMGYSAIHNDINPVAVFLGKARQVISPLEVLARKTRQLKLERKVRISQKERNKLLPFFHQQTLAEILALREILQDSRFMDPDLNYIGLTALSRLYGHSDGFFSVYTFPQISILPERQLRNNLKRGQNPEYKSIKDRIIKKMSRDFSNPLPDAYNKAASRNRYYDFDARSMQKVKAGSVDLIVTSPPFLDKVDYVQDNWMRAWFLGYEEALQKRKLAILENPASWGVFMKAVLQEMLRVLKPGGIAVVEVGEVEQKGQRINLEDLMLAELPISRKHGQLLPREVFINEQQFTKLANCWKVTNNQRGTNTNRCLILERQ